MTTDLLCDIRNKVFIAIAIQSLIVFALALVFLFLQGAMAFFSVILGAISWFLPSIYFICKLFIIKPQQQIIPQKFVNNLYIGEVIKLVLSGILVIIFLGFTDVLVLPFLIGYIAAVLSLWVLPIFLLNKR